MLYCSYDDDDDDLIDEERLLKIQASLKYLKGRLQEYSGDDEKEG